MTQAANSLGASLVTCPTGTSAIGGNEVNNGGFLVQLNEVSMSGSRVLVWLNNHQATPVTWHAWAVCVNGSTTGSSARLRVTQHEAPIKERREPA